ncbi:tryptophan-rich sensory protein [Candidatus Saccharibacteria bacterium]|nr:tryptophan-rich sensory protein [Candidatus Saccharibacteria bacterium]
MKKITKLKKSENLTVWSKVWRIALSIIVPLGGGSIISLFTMDAMKKFGTFNQPPLAPPAWLFPVAWTTLYILMGVASYLIWLHSYNNHKLAKYGKVALIIYGIQLIFNFAWTPFFFSLGWYWFALYWLLVMWALIIALMIKSFKISRAAFFMLLPYILWCTFAAYLNCGIAILN